MRKNGREGIMPSLPFVCMGEIYSMSSSRPPAAVWGRSDSAEAA